MVNYLYFSAKDLLMPSIKKLLKARPYFNSGVIPRENWYWNIPLNCLPKGNWVPKVPVINGTIWWLYLELDSVNGFDVTYVPVFMDQERM